MLSDLDAMLRKLIQSAHPSRQPWITRQSYAHELRTALTFPMAIAMVEGGIVSILARKTFGVSPMMFAAIGAAPMFAALTSFFWAWAARGKRKIPFITSLQTAALLSIASIALLPTTWPGPLLLTLLVILTRCLLVGMVTIRSSVWRMNYPRHVRAQTTGKLILIQTLILAFAPLVGYSILDLNPQMFRLVYPLSAVAASFGVMAFAGIRLRGEKDLLRYERQPSARPTAHGEGAPVYEYDRVNDPENGQGGDRTHDRPGYLQVLRRDHLFRRYMIWQFVIGCSNMMGQVVIVFIIADLTRGMRGEYLLSAVLASGLFLFVATCTVPLWARLMDRLHILQFRVIHTRVWIVTQLLLYLGTTLSSLWVIAAAQVVLGIGRGGGMLAWNLGHNDFADRRLVATYMGIHVTLTGVRGAIAPFVGMALYTGWDAMTLGSTNVTVPAFAGIGNHVFLVTSCFALTGMLGFQWLARSVGTPAMTERPIRSA